MAFGIAEPYNYAMSENEVIKEALALPLPARIKLTEQLLASLPAYAQQDDQDFDVPQDVIDDCMRIRDEINAGRMKTYPADEVMRRLRESRRGEG